MRRLVSATTAGAATLATLTLLASPASADPMVSDDNVSVRAGDYGQFPVADNDNGGGELLKVTTYPTTGFAYFDENQLLRYAAPRSFQGTVTLEYAAFDPDVPEDENDPSAGQIGAPATVTIDVTPVGALATQTNEIEAFVGETVDVDLGADDPNSGSIDSYSVGPDALSSTLGDLYVGAGGRGEFTGTEPGTETIDYDIADGVDQTAVGHGSVTITVEARNVTLTADSGLTTPADEVLVIDVLANDTGILADDTVEVSDPVRGDYAYFDQDQGKVVYSSSTVGSDTFTYTVHAADGTELGTKTVSLTVTAALKVSAHDDEYDAEKDTPNLLPVTENDRSDNPVTLTIVTGPTSGTASVVPGDDYNAAIRYTPDSGYTGADSLTYQLDDHLGHTSTATVTLRVTQVGVQNLASSVRWQGAHLTWTNPHATTFTGVVVRMNVGATSDDFPQPPQTPADGLEVSAPNGATSLDVGSLVNGNHYAFSVFAEYGAGVYSDPATNEMTPGIEPLVNLHADGGNTNVVLAWTNPTGLESVALTYNASNSSTSHQVTVPAGASTVLVPGLRNGTTYEFQAVSSGGGTESEAAYTSATPRSSNVKPVAVADFVSLNGAEPVTFWVDNNDTDANHDALQVVSTTQPEHGSVSCEAFYICTYTPQSGTDPSETDTFSYTLSDGHGGRATGVVTLARRHFVAQDDTAEATSVAYAQFDVLGNDTDYRVADRLAVDTEGFDLGTLDIAFGGDERQLVEFEPNGTAGSQVVGYTLYDENDVVLGHADLTVNVTLAPYVTMVTNHRVSSVNAAVVFSGRTTPARAGAPIQLERFSAGAWRVVQTKTIATASTTSDVRQGSPYSFSVRERTSGSFEYRVAVPADSDRARSEVGNPPLAMYAGALGSMAKTGNEYVVVRNSGKIGVNLKSWTITTRAGKKLTLPSKSLGAGRTVKVHPGTGRTTSTNIYLRRGASFGNRHDTLTLRDTRRVTVASKRY